jgi:hypothetical protein
MVWWITALACVHGTGVTPVTDAPPALEAAAPEALVWQVGFS